MARTSCRHQFCAVALFAAGALALAADATRVLSAVGADSGGIKNDTLFGYVNDGKLWPSR